jgi:hypothetical protein
MLDSEMGKIFHQNLQEYFTQMVSKNKADCKFLSLTCFIYLISFVMTVVIMITIRDDSVNSLTLCSITTGYRYPRSGWNNKREVR